MIVNTGINLDKAYSSTVPSSQLSLPTLLLTDQPIIHYIRLMRSVFKIIGYAIITVGFNCNLGHAGAHSPSLPFLHLLLLPYYPVVPTVVGTNSSCDMINAEASGGWC